MFFFLRHGAQYIVSTNYCVQSVKLGRFRRNLADG